MPLKWRNQFWQSLEEGAGKRCSDWCANTVLAITIKPTAAHCQGSRRDQKIKRSRGGRWSWTFKLAQKRSCVGRWRWAANVGLLSLRVFTQQQGNRHCPCDSAQARQLKQQLRSALVAGQWRGDTALTLPLFWRRSTVSPVFFGRYPRSSLYSFVPSPPPPPVPVPNKPPRFCGRKAKWSSSMNASRWIQASV